jgi:hypothetical protein
MKFSDREETLKYLSCLEKSPPVPPTDNDVIDMILQYISKNKLIIYGGTAIDIYLRKNSQVGIYSENEQPDIDIYTNDVIRDMYTITNMVFQKTKHKYVETIPSKTHQFSRRVRYEFGPNVIDLSPIGDEIFKKIPTFSAKIRGVECRFIDLPVIKMNFYFALSINPLQNVFRLRKDYERLLKINSPAKISGGAKQTSADIGFWTLADKNFQTKDHPITIFSTDPYSDVTNKKIKKFYEYAPIFDFPGYIYYIDSDGQKFEIYFFPESFIFMPRTVYGQLYFLHVKKLECICTGRNPELIKEYDRAIKYVEDGKFNILDVTPLLSEKKLVKQITSIEKFSFDRIYRPEKLFKEISSGEKIPGISGERLN